LQNPTFSQEFNARLSTDSATGAFASPVPVRASPDHQWRLYLAYTAIGSTTPAILSALADQPDVRAITPSTVASTDPAASHTISGEIFESTVAVVLTRSGESDIPGTDVVRNSDRSITATFDTQNKAVGAWDVVVQNADGKTGTLAGGFKIDIAAGQLTVTDNVFRPLKGQQVTFDITIFGPGRVTLRLYTLDGRLVRTLLDGDLSVGTTTVTWDGANDDGRVVATGGYFLECKGPRLNARQKIAVIK
jgi:hypothetical protein